jgi:hypothetical protein
MMRESARIADLRVCIGLVPHVTAKVFVMFPPVVEMAACVVMAQAIARNAMETVAAHLESDELSLYG